MVRRPRYVSIECLGQRQRGAGASYLHHKPNRRGPPQSKPRTSRRRGRQRQDTSACANPQWNSKHCKCRQEPRALASRDAGTYQRHHQIPPRHQSVPRKLTQVLTFSSNDEVERRGASPALNEADLSQSSTASLVLRRCAARSLEPIVRGRLRICQF